MKVPEGASVLLVGLGLLEDADTGSVLCRRKRSSREDRNNGQGGSSSWETVLYTPMPFRWCDLKQVPFPS